jgi:hypothetical protein
MKLWAPVVLVTLPALLIMRGPEKRLGTFAVTVGLSYLLVISFATSKLSWYEVSAYPFLALFAATAVKALVVWLKRKALWTKPVLITLSAVSALWVLTKIVITLDDSHSPRYREEHYRDQLSRYFQAFPNSRRVILGIAEYDAPAIYYHKYYESRSIELELRWPDLVPQPNDTILTSADEIKRLLQANEHAERIFEHTGMEGYVIKTPSTNSEPSTNYESYEYANRHHRWFNLTSGTGSIRDIRLIRYSRMR